MSMLKSFMNRFYKPNQFVNQIFINTKEIQAKIAHLTEEVECLKHDHWTMQNKLEHLQVKQLELQRFQLNQDLVEQSLPKQDLQKQGLIQLPKQDLQDNSTNYGI